MKTCSSSSTISYIPQQQHQHRHQISSTIFPNSKSHIMGRHDKGGSLKVFFDAAWIIWIYFFVIFLRLEHVDAKIGYFWHITDLHLDTSYSTKGDVSKSCWHIEHHQTNSANPPPGRFGDYMCDSPWSLLESATQAMKSRQGDNVEFVLWTGDGLAHSMRRNIETHRLDVLRNITDLLGRTFSSQFVFPVLGHEDGQPNNFRRLGELWRHWLPSEALQTFEKGGYYTIEQTKSRLRIIALNTNFMRHDVKYQQSHSAAIRQRPGSVGDLNEHNNYRYHHNNHYRSNGINGYSTSNVDEHGGTVSALSGGESHESQKQWDWLEDVLAKSSRNKETVYIVGHIPPGSDERQIGTQPNGHTTFSEKNNLRYLQLVRKYSSIILGQFFGHLHSDSFRIIYNDNGKPVSWIMIAPSVTPRKSSIGSNNPAMRLYKFETDTGQVLDYTQYYLDLASANSLGEAVWQPEYNLTTHYFGSGEVTAVALHNLADRFSNTENPLFAKYYRANSVRYPTPPCEGVCALNHYCAITRVDYHEFRHCLESAASALASSSARPNVCIPIAANIALLLATYTIMKCQQRKLLFDWLQFLFFDLLVNILLIKSMRSSIVALADKLPFQQQNYRVSMKLLSSPPSTSTLIRCKNKKAERTTTPVIITHLDEPFFTEFMQSIVIAINQLYGRSIDKMIVFDLQLKQLVTTNIMHSMINNQCHGKVGVNTKQSDGQSTIVCKLCQNVLFKKLVSSDQIQKAMHFNVTSTSYLSQKNNNDLCNV